MSNKLLAVPPGLPRPVGVMVRICRTLTAARGSHQVPKNTARVLTGGDLKKEVVRETRVLRTAESDVAAIDKGSHAKCRRGSSGPLVAGVTAWLAQSRAWPPLKG